MAGGVQLPAMVMERAAGTLQDQRLSGDALLRVAWVLATTLAALNKTGFIHGDLKPRNVLWKTSSASAWPLLTDF
eukprot:5106413-Amphidinium_carterae.1